MDKLITKDEFERIIKDYEQLEEHAFEMLRQYGEILGHKYNYRIHTIRDWNSDGNILGYGTSGYDDEYYISMPCRYLWEGLEEARKLEEEKKARMVEAVNNFKARQEIINRKTETDLLKTLLDKYPEIVKNLNEDIHSTTEDQ